MKKSILASLVAGLFVFSSVASEPRQLSVKVMQQKQGPVAVDVNNDGIAQTFEFSKEELKDESLLASRLAGLDEDVRKAVLNALKGLRDGGQTVFVDKFEADGDDNQRLVVVKDFNIDGDSEGVHKIFVKVDGDDAEGLHHHVVKTAEGEGYAFKIGSEFNDVKFVDGGEHMADVIEQLLNKAKLTPAQIDQLQQALDAKR